MTNKNSNQTDVNQVRRQNQQSAQNTNSRNEEFASETDVNQVRKQNQQAEANKRNASAGAANRFGNGSK